MNIYIKSYCYSEHELPFIIANLTENYDKITNYFLYEYNFTHTGLVKPYNLEKYISTIPKNLQKKLVYTKVDLNRYIKNYFNHEDKIHKFNEPIQRSWWLNDERLNLNPEDIIIDIDVDEIIYGDTFEDLIHEIEKNSEPLSIKLNLFFYKENYLWENKEFSSPTIYKYKMIQNYIDHFKDIKFCNIRDLENKTQNIYGAHLSWFMPIEFMERKLLSYSHPKYRNVGIKEIENSIKEKKYPWGDVDFDLIELDKNSSKIPIYFRDNINYFDYLETSEIEIPKKRNFIQKINQYFNFNS
jgi:hypothetical protein